MTNDWSPSPAWRALGEVAPLALGIAREEAALAASDGIPAEEFDDGFAMMEVAGSLLRRTQDGDREAEAALVAGAAWLEARPEDALADDFLLRFPDRGAVGEGMRELLGPRLRSRLEADRDIRNPPAVEALIERLVAAAPGARALADDNRVGDHRAILAYGFVADLARREEALVAGGSLEQLGEPPADPAAETRAVLGLLEEAAGAGEQEVRDLVGAGFIEALTAESPLVPLLGPRLRALFDAESA